MLALFRATRTILFKFKIEKGPKVRDAVIAGRKWSMYDDTVIGYDRNGAEAVRLPVLEPFYERPRQYLNSI